MKPRKEWENNMSDDTLSQIKQILSQMPKPEKTEAPPDKDESKEDKSDELGRNIHFADSILRLISPHYARQVGECGLNG
jgi:hypothetical protein